MNSALLKVFMRSAAWSFMSAIATKASVVIIGVLVARTLGAQAFGEYGLIQSAVVMLANVAAQATTTATAKHVSQCKAFAPEKTGRGIALTLAFCVMLSALISVVAVFFPVFFSSFILGADPRNYLSVIVLSYITLIILSGWTQGCLIGWGRYRTIALINGVGAVIAIPTTYYLTLAFSLQGALSGLAGTQLLVVLFGAVACCKSLKSKRIPIRLQGAMLEKQAILAVGLPLLLTGLMVAPMNWFANKLLAQTDNGLAALGLYAAAMQWNAICSHVSVVLGTVLVPMLASAGAGNSRQLEAINLLSGWLVVLIVIQPVIVFADEVATLYGPGFKSRDFEVTLSLVVLSALLSAFKSGISRKMVVMNLAWYSVFSNVVWGVMFMSGVLILKAEGAIGLAKALTYSQFAHFLLGLPYFIYKKIIPLELLFSARLLVLWLLPFISCMASAYIESGAMRLMVVAVMVACIVLIAVTLNARFDNPSKRKREPSVNISKVYVRGAYGPGNLGDDILMQCVINILKTRFADAAIAVGVEHPQVAKKINPFITWLHIKEPVIADLVVLGGGGQFFSFTPPETKGIGPWLSPSSLYKRISAQANLKSAFLRMYVGMRGGVDNIYIPRRLAAFCIGLGPFERSGKQLERAVNVINRCDYISVRDGTSQQHCTAFGRPGVRVYTDPTLLRDLWISSRELDATGLEKHKYLSFVLRDWPHDANGQAFIAAMVLAAHELSARGERVRLVSLYKERDQALIDKYPAFEWLCWDASADTHDRFIAKWIVESDVIISARAHGVLLPAALGYPTIAVEIENKLNEVHQMLPRGTQLVSVPDPGVMIAAIREFRYCKEQRARHLKQELSQRASLARQGVNDFLQWVDKTVGESPR